MIKEELLKKIESEAKKYFVEIGKVMKRPAQKVGLLTVKPENGLYLGVEWCENGGKRKMGRRIRFCYETGMGKIMYVQKFQ